MSSSAAMFEKLNLSIVSLSMMTKKKSREDTKVINNPKYPTSLSGKILKEVSEFIARSQSCL
jgi:hypothetical protein